MALKFHPKQGTILRVRFDGAFKEPEMVKPRLCVVISKPIQARFGLCTVVPLSTTPPNKPMPYHCEIDIPFRLPDRWGQRTRWLKGDMVYSAGFHRMDLLLLGKDRNAKRIYQTQTLAAADMARVQACVLHGLSLSSLTRHL
ncbi:type II toxin-antitoxin system PemK/MazF family toxin [Roseovarius nitratireducens]|uniref:type II toxin-antitoxin system PemK/MazF family toxin n=1 Tax=Roseovarius nitratireducens TaxID=2044597 RepID=UPI000CE1D057|nr:type II toxin-antitoxin system PemK/MazF family toxin [Roseovarius nitratireducens]